MNDTEIMNWLETNSDKMQIVPHDKIWEIYEDNGFIASGKNFRECVKNANKNIKNTKEDSSDKETMDWMQENLKNFIFLAPNSKIISFGMPEPHWTMYEIGTDGVFATGNTLRECVKNTINKTNH